jgi:N-carbamoylputrescine amidase
MQRSAAERDRIAKSLLAPGARPLIVGAYQMANHCGGQAGKAANLARMLRVIDVAAEQKVQVLAFPEQCLPGYHVTGTPVAAAEIVHHLADEPGKSETLDQLAAAARRAKMVIGFGFCELAERKYYNSIGLIDADGSWLGSRRKNPLSPHPHETEVFTEPDAAERTAAFKTRYVTLGLANCFDGEFPESIRRMRLAGAELLLWCNAGTGNPATGHSSRINASGSYAQANRLWVVCCNAVAERFYGTSLIVGPAGEPLVVLPPAGEALAVATINLAQTADWERWRLRLDPIWR